MGTVIVDTTKGVGIEGIQADMVMTQINDSLAPSQLKVHNDSSKHSHHRAMEGSTSSETHFRYEDPTTTAHLHSQDGQTI